MSHDGRGTRTRERAWTIGTFLAVSFACVAAWYLMPWMMPHAGCLGCY